MAGVSKPRMKHILRAVPPWREPSTTAECRPATNFLMVTRSEADELYRTWVKDFYVPWQNRPAPVKGVDRPSFGRDMKVCHNCLEKVKAWKAWEADPVDALKRYLETFQSGGPGDQDWIRVVAELETFVELFREDEERFRTLVTRRQAMATLSGMAGGR